jgi:hypothetical protein
MRAGYVQEWAALSAFRTNSTGTEPPAPRPLGVPDIQGASRRRLCRHRTWPVARETRVLPTRDTRAWTFLCDSHNPTVGYIHA